MVFGDWAGEDDMAGDEGGNVSHEVAAVVVEKKTADGEAHFMTRYVNMVAWWPVLVTILIVGSNIGVYFYFNRYDLDITLFMGFEDYAATTALAAIMLLAIAAILFIIVQTLALMLYPLTGMAMRRLAGAKYLRSEHEVAIWLACLLLLGFVVYQVIAFWLNAGGAPDHPRNIQNTIDHYLFAGGFAVIGLFLLSVVLRPIGPVFLRLSLILQLIALIFAPALSAYAYFDRIRPMSDLGVDMKSVDLGSNVNNSHGHDQDLIAACGRYNRLVWGGSKALVIQCENNNSPKFLIIANPDSEHVSKQSLSDANATSAASDQASSDEASVEPGTTIPMNASPAGPQTSGKPRSGVQVVGDPPRDSSPMNNFSHFLQDSVNPGFGTDRGCENSQDSQCRSHAVGSSAAVVPPDASYVGNVAKPQNNQKDHDLSKHADPKAGPSRKN